MNQKIISLTEFMQNAWDFHHVSIELSTPPSVNKAYLNSSRGRIKSMAYRRWIVVAREQLSHYLIKPGYLEPPYAVIYEINKTDNRRRDCANYEKCLSDFFTTTKIIEDDSLINFNIQCWMNKPALGKVARCHLFSLSQ